MQTVSEIYERLAGWAAPSRTKAAAALLVLSTFVPGQHPAPVAQAKVFGEPETFVQVRTGAPLLTNGTVAGWNALRQPQAKWFGEPESFAQTQIPRPLLLNGRSAGATDPRQRQAIWFTDPESIAQPQTARPLILNGQGSSPYQWQTDVRRARQAQSFSSYEGAVYTWQSLVAPYGSPPYYPWQDIVRAKQAQVWSDPERFDSPQRPALLVLNGSAAPPSNNVDLCAGQDTLGWPPVEIPWAPAQSQSTVVVLTHYTPYNPAVDVQRAGQARWFTEAESFPKAQLSAPLILNGHASYIIATDVQRTRQAIVFGEPETFARSQVGTRTVLEGFAAGAHAVPQPQSRVVAVAEEFTLSWRPASLLINGTAGQSYNAATDVRRARQAQTVGDAESFSQVQVGRSVLINGSIAGWNAIPQRQARIFGSPDDVFVRALPATPLVINGSPYDPSIELRRAQTKWFSSTESQWEFNFAWMGKTLNVNQPASLTITKGDLIPLPHDDRRIVIVIDDRRIYPVPST